MIACDEESLICDFAETYNIYNYTELPLHYVAILAAGLRDNSRIRQKLTNSKADGITIMLSAIFDKLSILVWQNTEDGQQGINMPVSVSKMLTAQEKEFRDFDSVEEFNKYWSGGF